MLHLIKAGEIRLIGGAEYLDQILEPGFIVIIVSELEDGLSGSLR
jgi:hypothetical protein